MSARRANTVVSVIVLLALLIQPLASGATAPQPQAAWLPVADPTDPGFLFRASVTLEGSRNLARLEKAGVQVLRTSDSDGKQIALVLADGDQLADLARLGFRPQAADELRLLVNAQGPEKQWLAESFQPLLTQADAVVQEQALAGAAAAPDAAALQVLRTSVQALTPEQLAGVAGSASVDDDADGLTNTQESWWCTDPMNPDSDGDGVNDGDEVAALKDWIGNRRAGPPSSGKPFAGWPPQTTSAGNPGRTFACQDDDRDAVPDLAERWELGLNMNRESTDRDKFDDGQELFGYTNCPGGDASCGYGDLPRSSDTGFVGAAMPSWVKAPGNHPLVAAFPVPEVDVVESSLKVQTVATITTDHTIGSGTEQSYSTAKTDGTSTSVANTQTWNNWQEITDSREQIPGIAASALTIGSEAATLPGPLNARFESTALVEARANLAKECAELGRTTDWSNTAGIEGGPVVVKVKAEHGWGGSESTSLAPEYRPECKAARVTYCKIAGGQDPYCQEEISSVKLTADSAISVKMLDMDNLVGGLSGIQFAETQSGQLIGLKLTEIAKVLAAPRETHSVANGSSVGGARTTTSEQYQEHTVTNGEAFSTNDSWGTATAVDSAHAADLWFTYKVRNSGTEYARELGDLAFNIYINDDPNPAVTYFVAPELGGDGKSHNFMPGEEHTYTSRRIPLTLNQMQAIDVDPACAIKKQMGQIPADEKCPGGKVRIIVEDFTYGADELFYQDAANAGVQIAIEDGLYDGDEAIDTYLIPTWGTETVLDVLARYFPHTIDENGMMVAVWAPEYRADTPDWCVEPRPIGTGSQRTLWCKHALSTADWWNVYTNGMGDGSEGFQDIPASPGSVALFRFNQDSDLDGYSDRSEERLGTDPNDPASYPKPELLAGIHSIRAGNLITATLSLLNTGLYDAYGVEAVMIAPNDTISITNNTVGGSGRVRAQKQVIVGSRIVPQTPLPSAWLVTGHAQPTAGGYYTGIQDRTYTFTVQCGNSGGCVVGTDAWTLAWNDGKDANGTLAFDAMYKSPTLRDVGAFGVKLGFLSGKVNNNENFTVAANTPRDTFQYTIAAGHESDFTPPIVLVSYNDPQGNHRFVVPTAAMALASPTTDLMAFSGQMLQEPGVEIVTAAAAATGANTTDLVVNNPTGVTLTNAHLFMEFVNITGTVTSEVPVTTNLPPGPNVVPVDWNTAAFNPAYDPAQDYIVMAFLTDYQGNILDTAARPLSSFQVDPKPSFDMATADETWDFGTAVRGTILKRSFTFANTGFSNLQTYVSAPAGLTVSQTGSRRIGPADMTTYEMTLNTANVTMSAYNETVTIRTSDPDVPTRTVHVLGTITAGAADTQPGAVVRPLDWPASVSGTLGDWVQFTHTLGPEPQTLHPVKVYSQDYGTLWGVGKYATPFSAGTASYDMFGDGRDGVMPSSGNLDNANGFGAGQVVLGTQGYSSISVSDQYGIGRINPGDVVLIHQTQGTGAGNWELNKAVSDFTGGGTFLLANPLQHTYSSQSGSDRAQILRVPQYSTCNVTGTVTPLAAWNGTWGGIFAVMCSGTMNVSGTIDGNAKGFRGGPPPPSDGDHGSGMQGEGQLGYGGRSSAAYGCAGGGGGGDDPGEDHGGGGGGGGGHLNAGLNGSYGAGGIPPGIGGSIAGNADLTSSLLGCGGGGGGPDDNDTQVGPGGVGGGMVYIAARTIQVQGAISANGNAGGNGSSSSGGGGGGSGGAVLLRGREVNTGSSLVRSLAGSGGSAVEDGGAGGAGSTGRIRVEYCSTLSGTTTPAASTQKLNCYLAEQVESSPYTTTRLNLPETGTHTYQVQYGRKLNYAGAAALLPTLRVPAGMFSSVTMQALVSDLASNAFLNIDVGNTGTSSWSGTVSNNSENTSPNLAPYFNAYWASHGAPTTGTLDVPLSVYLDRASQVLLSNLQVTQTGSKLRHIRLPARPQGYSSVTVNFTVSGGSGPLAVGVDIGANGSVDWKYIGSPDYPANLTAQSTDLTTAVNTYLAGGSGEMDVPIRFYLAPFVTLDLTGFSAALVGQPDALISASDVSFGATDPVEGDEVSVSVTLHNTGSLDTGRLTASFYATSADWGEWYIGSAFAPNVPAGGTAQAEILWNTLGFTGMVPVRVSIDPYNRLAETNESNNEATASLSIKTRPDLHVTQIALTDGEPTAGETVTATLSLRNDGQTAAAASALALYEGNPDASGTLIAESALSAAAGAETTASFAWTPTAPGLHRLFARADRDRQVNEYDEGNNDRWLDVYVGFRDPILVDSGAITQDPPYTTTLGYGAVDEGQTDEFGNCGSEPWQTFRRDPGGRAVYRFDHLLPGHFYHLDLGLYLCGQAGRDETIYVDGNQVAGPEHLGDGQRHRLSLRLDPALYADRTISVTVETAGLGGAVVNEVNLYDVDYRYSDAGGANDPPYTAGRGYGYLPGTSPRTQWGTLPFKSLRENQSGNSVSYRYDGLLQSKRYQAWLSFWQNTGSPLTQKVQINGVDTGAVLTIQSGTPYSTTINVPTSYYMAGTITVTVVRTDATTSAMVNEIALEERTLLNLPAIRDVRVSNVGDTSATISWLSADPADGQAHYGPSPALGAIGQDERVPAPVSRTHQVTLLDLMPETNYYFYVTSADSVATAADGALYQFASGPSLSLPSADMIYGQVFNPDNSPAAGALVYVTLRDADGQDSPGTAAPLSALVDAEGNWGLNLGSARTADNTAPFTYDPANDRLDISATQGTSCAANLTIHTVDDYPAPPMTLACPTQVTHSLGTSWNLVGLNVRTDPATAAEVALDDIVAQGGNAIEIERWWNGGWDAHVRDLPFNNFALELGRGYFVRTTKASAWARTGTPPSSPLPVELYPGWNLIAMPKLTCALAAENVLVGIAAQAGACGEMDRWYAGNWQGHIKGLSLNNFAIATDQGYFVKCTQRSTYVPCQAAAQSAVTTWPQPAAPAPMTPESRPVIRDVQVSNRRDVAFTVSWRTDRPSTGWLEYGADGALDGIAHDDRGEETVGTLHHVTVTGLASETVYAFRVRSGESTADMNDRPYQVTTAASTPPTPPALPLIAYGQALDAAGQPAAGALVRAQIASAAEPLSALTDGWGYWALSLPVEDCAGQTLLLEARSLDGTITSTAQPACDVQPVPALTLRMQEQKPIYLPLVVR